MIKCFQAIGQNYRLLFELLSFNTYPFGNIQSSIPVCQVLLKNRLGSSQYLLCVVLISCGSVLSTSCNTNRENNQDSKSDNAFIVIEERRDSVNPVDERVLRFLAAEPTGRDNKSIRLTIQNIEMNWEDLAADHLKPRSKENPNGVNLEEMEFGDFGWNEYASLMFNHTKSYDTLDYYAISNDTLLPLQLDSIETKVTYSIDKNIHYSGHFVGYSEREINGISFVIQTNQKDLKNHLLFLRIPKDQISVSKDINDPESFELKLLWNNNTYLGRTDESEIILTETKIIQTEQTGNYLITSWTDDGIGHQCEYYYRLFKIEKDTLRVIGYNDYDCDI